MTTDDYPRTTRGDSLRVPCPVCGAPAGEWCRRENPSHPERHGAAVDAGAPRYERNGRTYELVGGPPASPERSDS